MHRFSEFRDDDDDDDDDDEEEEEAGYRFSSRNGGEQVAGGDGGGAGAGAVADAASCPDSICSFIVSVGAFAAHPYGFGSGGLRRITKSAHTKILGKRYSAWRFGRVPGGGRLGPRGKRLKILAGRGPSVGALPGRVSRKLCDSL